MGIGLRKNPVGGRHVAFERGLLQSHSGWPFRREMRAYAVRREAMGASKAASGSRPHTDMPVSEKQAIERRKWVL